MNKLIKIIILFMVLIVPGCRRDAGMEQGPQPKKDISEIKASVPVEVASVPSIQEADTALSSNVRFYFTGARSEVEIAQLLSMRADGSGLLQHTTGGDMKYGIYECIPSERVYFSRDESLAVLAKDGQTRTLLSKDGVQYHSPRCSFDGGYLSVTAWDKEAERGYIEVYDANTMLLKQRWEGEYASWARDRDVIVYRLMVQEGKPPHVDVYIRDMDKSPGTAERLYSTEIGEYVYDLTEPQLVGPGPRDVVFRVYDEHEYFYYLNEPGNSFVKTRGGMPLEHHNVYTGDIGESLEQAALSVSPDGKLAVIEEHPWNTPPSLYLVDMETRDSWKMAEGFNLVWSRDSKLVLFNKDPKHYDAYREAAGKGIMFSQIYPKSLTGYEIYVHDIELKKEYRLTDNDLYEGFL